MVNNKETRLTTIDNPYDPFEQFTLWWLFDIEKNYNTCSYVARLVQPKIFEGITDKEYDEVVEEVYDFIIENDFLNIYKKVFKNGSKKEQNTTKSDVNADDQPQ